MKIVYRGTLISLSFCVLSGIELNTMTRFALVGLWLCAKLTTAGVLISRDYPSDQPLTACPGYRATNVHTTATGLTADLKLAGKACNVYGTDLDNLILEVTYETDNRLHVKIQDAANQVYQVPASVLPRPAASGVDASASALKFAYKTNPFSFTVSRSKTGEVLFDTSAASLVFESQYLRLRTKLPNNPNLYGLGEHSDPFRLNTTDYIRTLGHKMPTVSPMARTSTVIILSTSSTGLQGRTECFS